MRGKNGERKKKKKRKQSSDQYSDHGTKLNREPSKGTLNNSGHERPLFCVSPVSFHLNRSVSTSAFPRVKLRIKTCQRLAVRILYVQTREKNARTEEAERKNKPKMEREENNPKFPSN